MNTPTKPNDGGPKAETKPETFELNSKTWFKHVPGDPRPCDPDAFVEVMFSDGDFGYHVGTVEKIGTGRTIYIILNKLSAGATPTSSRSKLALTVKSKNLNSAPKT